MLKRSLSPDTTGVDSVKAPRHKEPIVLAAADGGGTDMSTGSPSEPMDESSLLGSPSLSRASSQSLDESDYDSYHSAKSISDIESEYTDDADDDDQEDVELDMSYQRVSIKIPPLRHDEGNQNNRTFVYGVEDMDGGFGDGLRDYILLVDAYPSVSRHDGVFKRICKQVFKVPENQPIHVTHGVHDKYVRATSNYRAKLSQIFKAVMKTYTFDTVSLPEKCKNNRKRQFKYMMDAMRFARKDYLSSGAILQSAALGDVIAKVFYHGRKGIQLSLKDSDDQVPRPVIAFAFLLGLITLKLVEPVDADMSSLPMATWPTLRTLHLYGARKDITCDEIIGIWKRFPSLKELELTSCIDLQSTRFVSEFCPSMKSLNIRMYVMGLKLTYTDDEENNNEVQGVTKLDIDTNDIPDEIVKDISSIIKQHHHTLEHLVWKTDTTHDTEYVGLFQYPRLRKLGLISSGWQIPRNAPLLEELMLTSRIISTQPQVLDMIPPHLNKLELKLEGPLQPVAKSSIERYLTRMSLQCQLKELVVRFNSEDDFTSIMDAIFRHGQLECLKISFTYAWDSDQMERFFHSLVKGCPRLSRLELKCSNAPSTYSITTLKGLAHLNMFAFSIYGSDGIDGFWDALRSFSQLRCLRIYPNAAIYKTNIAYLKEQRPDMKIINHPFDTTFEPSF
ncbi:hypothetical protein O0I10_006656 [Lichtheimia ornata]|uniref:DUF6532 domain-containing protein n=1 Tax=Lichtheimia ornata TaxID=688661 RepID=A0AAD7Y0S8_9FUNG|nr:uncharacterized protein O0I10_006656 [Lichtheimia ornata]KAJ8657592.1 hypothetical protein O0I10_006656 [Lichtheimia ornata]